MVNVIRLIVVVLLFAAAALFAAENYFDVRVSYFIGSFAWPMPWLMLFVLVIGIFFGFLIALSKVFRLTREVQRLRKEIKVAEAEVNNLRNIPIKDAH